MLTSHDMWKGQQQQLSVEEMSLFTHFLGTKVQIIALTLVIARLFKTRDMNSDHQSPNWMQNSQYTDSQFLLESGKSLAVPGQNATSQFQTRYETLKTTLSTGAAWDAWWLWKLICQKCCSILTPILHQPQQVLHPSVFLLSRHGNGQADVIYSILFDHIMP